MPENINILIVEDHPIFRMGLTELIENETDMTVCGYAQEVTTAMALIEQTMPHLVIVDLSLKESNGMELIKFIHNHHRQVLCLVLSMHDESLHAERCVLAGAKGYIMKQDASRSLVTVIRQILSGRIYVSEKIMSQILNKFQNQPDLVHVSPLKRLTDRELEIFQYIGNGQSSGKIAGNLNISVKTIGTHRERIKEKLGINSSGELVRNAVIWVETGSFKPLS